MARWSAARWSRRISRVRTAAPADLKGGDKARNLEIANAVLAGDRGPQRDIVLVNAAAALVAAGKGGDVPGRGRHGRRFHRHRRGARQGGSPGPLHPECRLKIWAMPGFS